MKNKILIGSVLCIAIGLISCKRTDVPGNTINASLTGNLYAATSEVLTTTINQTISADEHSVTLEKFDGLGDAFIMGPDGHRGPGGPPDFGFGPVRFGIPHIDSCASVTVSSSSYPKEITIEYNPNCTDRRGHSKSGKIIIDISDTIINAGAITSITYQNVVFDSISVSLSATMKNLGQNSSGNWVIEKKYEETIIKTGDTTLKVSDETFEWKSGFLTADKSDDIFLISGSGSITLNDTATYSRTITKPLLFDASCAYIESGTVELNRNGSIVTIDYGDGICDSYATVTSNGITDTISLQSNRFGDHGGFGKECHGFGRHHRD